MISARSTFVKLSTSWKSAVDRYPWIPTALVALSFLLFIFYYMTPEVLHPTTTVYGFGDNTAGPIWRYDVSSHSPFWGYERVTNYPYGESLYSPVAYSGSVQYLFYWLMAKAVGPILAYNFLNFIGLFLTAMVMYGFINYLTKRRWLAWLSGYAVTFSPYYQVKIGGHPTYAYQAMFIGIIWLFYKLLKQCRRRDAIYLGVLLAVSFYTDPYFVLLAGITIVGLTIFWLLANRRFIQFWFSRQHVASNLSKLQFKRLLLTFGITLVLILPLAAVYVTQRSQINSDVSAARGDVLAEAKACSNWPQEYLVPFVLNPVFEKAFGTVRYNNAIDSLKDNFSCGIGEDTVGLSLTLVTITGLGLIVFSWEKLNKRPLLLGKILTISPRGLLSGVGLVILIATAIGLPPIKYHGIESPSYILLSLTTTWRTLTRVYVLVNIGLVVFAAVVMAYFSNHFEKHKLWLAALFSLAFLGIFVEYTAFLPFHGDSLANFNYAKSAPAAYEWLKSQPSIKVVAEYPLEREGGESDAVSYYVTMQSIDGKKLFNSYLPTSPQENIRSGLKSLDDPQTIGVLRAFGVDTVVVHGVPVSQAAKIPYARVLYQEDQPPFNLTSHTPTVKHDNIVIISIKDAPEANYVTMLGNGFVRNTNIIASAVDWQYEAVQNSVLQIGAISNQRLVTNSQSRNICFEAKMSVPTDQDSLDLIVDGKTLPAGQLSGQYRLFEVSALKQVVLHNRSGHNMRVRNIGCTSS